MSNRYLHILAATTIFTAVAPPAQGGTFNIPGGDLDAALESYSAQSGVQLMVPNAAVHGIRTKGVRGDLSDGEALSRILSGTGFTSQQDESGVIGIVRERHSQSEIPDIQLAQAMAPRASVETVTVTSSKLGGADVQSVPIAITAMSQEQLTSTQTAGGPDLVKQVPNLTFTKTNFTGYNIQIRGIGTQAISVSTDPAVAVAFNDTPFLRNHFFEQEFFDVQSVQVLRGPQGTLFGRNATAGVVNVISAKPSDQWEARASVDVGNYNNRRLEGMVNIPIVGDMLDLRIAGEWTKRDGYAFNEETDKSIDGRDLWSGRVSLLIHPIRELSATFIWEHFQEDDDRMRSTKQLCKRDNPPSVVDGPGGPIVPDVNNFGAMWLTQGCQAESLYSPQSYETPNASGIPFILALEAFTGYLPFGNDPYGGITQTPDLRKISAQINPKYRARNNTYEFNVDYNVTPDLKVTSQTGYNGDTLYSTEDYNRFNTAAGIWSDPGGNTLVGQDGEYCDPQLGCSSRFIAQDVSEETASQFYQEIRMSSSFSGPFNFVAGGNYLTYHTRENYYVFANAITMTTEFFNAAFAGGDPPPADAPHIPFDPVNANSCDPQPADPQAISALFGLGCAYVDPNPLGSIDGQGHNYFRSNNPAGLSSWALFGEAYYNVSPDIKLTGGLRYTDDKKSFEVIPSWTLVNGMGYVVTDRIKQEWKEFTGRAVVNWTPKLDFTDESLFYASYAHGYKSGGANPPGVIPLPAFDGGFYSSPSNLTHPATFKPEYNNAFEVGTKNTLLDGGLTVNGDVFFYKYKDYQISQIVDRTAINLNFNATVRGAEIETNWEPLPGLKLGFNGGYENATFDDNQYAIDLMDRTAGHPGWIVLKPAITETSNCVLPTYVINAILASPFASPLAVACGVAYGGGSSLFAGTAGGYDPVTADPYTPNPNPVQFPNYPGFDPLAGTAGDPYTGQNTFNGVDYGPVPNSGEGFEKSVGGNQLPNSPHFTTSISADYTMPLSADWAGTLHGDFYWQSRSYWRIFNDSEYDKLEGYTNLNFALIFTNQDGWQAMAYVKNVLDTTAITGAFLNSDDSALTTNVFVTDPRLFGIRITKNW